MIFQNRENKCVNETENINPEQDISVDKNPDTEPVTICKWNADYVEVEIML